MNFTIVSLPTVTVTNTGEQSSSITLLTFALGSWPQKQLIGFNRTATLVPGEIKVVAIELMPSALLSYSDSGDQSFYIEAGLSAVLVEIKGDPVSVWTMPPKD